MNRLIRRLAPSLLLLIAVAAPAAGQAPRAGAVVQPIAGADPYVAVPGGKFLADSAHTYHVVFEARKGADKPDQLIQAVNMAGSEMNTFAAHKVPSANVKLVLVFHTTGSNEAVLTNTAYKAKHGVNNPNLPVLAALKRQGVEIYVCGQSLLGDHVALKDVDTNVATIAEDGVVVLMTYGSMGYAQLVF